MSLFIFLHNGRLVIPSEIFFPPPVGRSRGVQLASPSAKPDARETASEKDGRETGGKSHPASSSSSLAPPACSAAAAAPSAVASGSSGEVLPGRRLCTFDCGKKTGPFIRLSP
ncbi:hypothetical protein XENTR_v10010062 [Xenopus tropicalis]|nr:hypothetical protein XENTR_v10010062 [Xenopus tropicalis]